MFEFGSRDLHTKGFNFDFDRETFGAPEGYTTKGGSPNEKGNERASETPKKG